MNNINSRLIGKEGKIKKRLFEKYQFSFNISKAGELIVRKKGKLEKRFSEFLFWVDIGFNPLHSAYCIYRNKILESISFEQFVKGNKRKQRYKIGNLIGREGSIKEKIEKLSNTRIVINKKGCYILGSEKKCHFAKILIRRRLANFPFFPEYDEEIEY